MMNPSQLPPGLHRRAKQVQSLLKEREAVHEMLSSLLRFEHELESEMEQLQDAERAVSYEKYWKGKVLAEWIERLAPLPGTFLLVAGIKYFFGVFLTQ